MYASFDYTHVTTIDIPEMELLEQEVAIQIEVDGHVEEFHIDDIHIRTHHMVRHPNSEPGRAVWESKVSDIPIDPATIEAIVSRLYDCPTFENDVFECAHEHLGNRF